MEFALAPLPQQVMPDLNAGGIFENIVNVICVIFPVG